MITDGLAAAEARQMPLLGFLAKSLREANFPTLLAQKADRKPCRFRVEFSLDEPFMISSLQRVIVLVI